MSYRQGQTLVLTIQFTVDGVLTDPTTVTARIRPPNIANEYTIAYPHASLTKLSTGTYQVKVLLNDDGNWIYGITGSGVVDAYCEGVVDVSPTLFV